MKKIKRAIKRIKKKIKSFSDKIRNLIKRLKECRINSLIYKDWETSPIEEDRIFVTSRNGHSLGGNMLRLMLEIERTYPGKYKMVIGVLPDSKEKIRRLLDSAGLKDVTLSLYDSVEYNLYLQRSKYLFNDTTFPNRFIKREGQIYVNTWHGTPLKHMGIHNTAERVTIDNIQRNLFATDYMVFPSNYCRDIMIDAYCLRGLYQGKILMSGYPRNDVFFDQELRARVRSEQGLDSLKVYAYMPTYRDGNQSEKGLRQANLTKMQLAWLDRNLHDDEILFVNFHYYVSGSIHFESYRHVRPFPSDMETYEFLSAADCLISDYSSVMYDYANTGRKIIRFAYDEQLYFDNRGVYEQPVEMPFPVVKTLPELLTELRTPKEYDDRAFCECFCTYDNLNAAGNIIRRVFENKPACVEESVFDAETEHVLLYGGSFALNGITSALKAVVRYSSVENRRYYAGFSRAIVSKRKENLNNIPENCDVLVLDGRIKQTLSEYIAWVLFKRFNRETQWIQERLETLFQREARRHFAGMGFKCYIHYTGYDVLMTNFFQRAPGNRLIFIHTDMEKELQGKTNQHRLTARNAYRNYDHVVCVSESAEKSARLIAGDKIPVVVIPKFIDFDGIRERARQEIVFQESTVVFNSESKSIFDFLEKHPVRFITIGRFSKEKRHDRLLEAFSIYQKEHPETGLIIIGGNGKEYSRTIKAIKSSDVCEHVFIIKSMLNPMPVLQQSDLFILSSDYEARPVVFDEAACLEKPILSTNGIGISEYFEESDGGMVVDCSVEGLVSGMEAFHDGKIRLLKTNYKQQNDATLKLLNSVISY